MTAPTPITSPDWGVTTKRIIAVLLVVTIGLFFVRVSGALALVVIATVLAFLLTPTVNLIDRVLRFLPGSRPLSVLIVFILSVVMLVLVLLLIVPVLVQQVVSFTQDLPDLAMTFEDNLNIWLGEPLSFRGQPILIGGEEIVPLQRLQDLTGAETLAEMLQFEQFDLNTVAQSVVNSVSGLTRPVFSFVGGAFNTVLNLTFLLVMMFYLMKDGHKFVNRTIQVMPEDYKNDVRRLIYEFKQVWNAYIRGQLLLGLIMGTTTFLATSALGLPNAPILGLLAGILEFIPNLGPILAAIPAVFLALISQSATLPFLDGFTFALVTIGVYMLLQQIEAIVLVPRVMGDSLELHPFVVIVGVLIGASIAGALGIILAAPFTASLRILLQYFYGKLLDQNPFPHRERRRPLDITAARRVGNMRLIRRWRRLSAVEQEAEEEASLG